MTALDLTYKQIAVAGFRFSKILLELKNFNSLAERYPKDLRKSTNIAREWKKNQHCILENEEIELFQLIIFLHICTHYEAL